MSIEIKKDLCIGCGKCTEVCPGSLIGISESKAHMRYPEKCWACASCLKECKVGALTLYLGKDIGGLGGKLSVMQEGVLLHWILEKPDGSRQTITIDSRNSNKY